MYEYRDDTDEDMLLVRMGLPGAADASGAGRKVQEDEVTAPVVAVAGRRVPRVGVVRGQLNPAADREGVVARVLDDLPRNRRRELGRVLQFCCGGASGLRC